ncbi:hypothetical protein E2C01_092276 [Portunus trituberculatus]|uniref:Uncharacterized protein n=1 Tax=Portunus trituberculatus TaxID=210409 RepID=A0A5B7JQ53_PORTR|nr:hypothetical protein [Portunus trituberculatus]
MGRRRRKRRKGVGSQSHAWSTGKRR